jgi:hypothetical protein
VALAGGRSEVFAGSELETYLRNLQLVGLVSLYPWSVRSFSARELDRLFPRDSAHPWARHYDLAASPPAQGRLTLDVVRPTPSVRFNSGFPYGSNDGPIWAGRGLTSAVQAGFALRYGPLSLTVAPTLFRAENASFSLMANGDTGKFVYADGLHPGTIDRPQRFGNRPYAVIDAGQSTLRLDAGWVAAGVSTANQYWGPAAEYAAILGNHAAGFPHVFLGTAQPLDLWLFRVHGRLVWGRLSQSAFSPETASAGIRFMAGLVGVVTSRWIPGLEVGLSRFIHTPWQHSGPSLSDLLAPLHSHNRQNQTSLLHEDQLASVFARWVFPHSGVEVYSEYGREDYNANLRDLIEEPDHVGGYTASVGFRKVFASAMRLLVISGELQNQQQPRSSFESGRVEPVYTHSPTPLQGHTQRGQILGSDLGPGGSGATIALDWYSPRGRWSVRWTRVLRADRGTFFSSSQVDPRDRDVQHALGVEGLLFRGRYDVLAGLTAVYEFNRNFIADAFNLNAVVGVRANVAR